jgi:hypothetical protein
VLRGTAFILTSRVRIPLRTGHCIYRCIVSEQVWHVKESSLLLKKLLVLSMGDWWLARGPGWRPRTLKWRLCTTYSQCFPGVDKTKGNLRYLLVVFLLHECPYPKPTLGTTVLTYWGRCNGVSGGISCRGTILDALGHIIHGTLACGYALIPTNPKFSYGLDSPTALWVVVGSTKARGDNLYWNRMSRRTGLPQPGLLGYKAVINRLIYLVL